MELAPAGGKRLATAVDSLIAVFSDRIILALLFGIALLGLLDFAQLLPSLVFVIEAIWSMLPYFLLALAMAAYTRAAGADAVIARLFGGNQFVAIVMAAGFGAVSPFCSCGVIPVIAALLIARVPLAPVMAFWIASPIMDPEMFVLTAAGISGEFAIAKTMAAAAMGLTAGFAVWGLSGLAVFRQPMKSSLASGCGTCSDSCSEDKPTTEWLFWRSPERVRAFKNAVVETGAFLGKWLAIAFFIESLMLAYLPPELVASAVGGDSWLVIPLAAVVGVPAYLNGYAAIPLVSGLMDLGMSPGAALAFITAGAVSSIPAATAVFALVRLPVFATYILLGLAGSIGAGAIYQWVAV